MKKSYSYLTQLKIKFYLKNKLTQILYKILVDKMIVKRINDVIVINKRK